MSRNARAEGGLSRALDVALAALALLITLPLLVAVAVAVRVTMGRPVLFRQSRSGKGGRPFELIKFRTMRNAQLDQAGPDHDGKRLTNLGRRLRALSLDELPALVNVLRGEMSLVGPRPLPVRYLSRYSAAHSRRHEVAPGITGPAQVNGRNSLSWDEQLDLDVWYVENRSPALDLRILARTAAAVLRRDGISHAGHATRPEFPGSGAPVPTPSEDSWLGRTTTPAALRTELPDRPADLPDGTLAVRSDAAR